MAPSIIYNNTALREVFLHGQIFVFGGFALRANSLGHLEQIDSYAPGHQIGFGNLDYVADIRGDLIFQGFATPTSALALDPERISRSEDGSLEPAGLSVLMGFATGEAPDTPLDSKSELLRSVPSGRRQEAPTLRGVRPPGQGPSTRPWKARPALGRSPGR